MSHWDESYQALLRYCQPAGTGVQAGYLGQGMTRQVQQKLYQTHEISLMMDKWQAGCEQAGTSSTPCVLGVPFDTGSTSGRGASWAPMLLRQQWLNYANEKLNDLGDLRVLPQLTHDDYCAEPILKQIRQMLYDDASVSYPVSPLSTCQELVGSLWRANPDFRLLTLGGDQTISAMLIEQYIATREHDNFVVIHFDAFNDCDGGEDGGLINHHNWVPKVSKELSEPTRFIQCGVQESLINSAQYQTKIQHYTCKDITKQSPKSISEKITDYCKKNQIQECYVSVDISIFDSSQASATANLSRHGLMVPQVITIIDHLASHLSFVGADLMEIAPFVCVNSNKSDEPRRTLITAKHVMSSLYKGLKK